MRLRGGGTPIFGLQCSTAGRWDEKSEKAETAKGIIIHTAGGLSVSSVLFRSGNPA